MTARQPIPTLGYPTQKAACVALCLAGKTPKQISALTGASLNTVHRSLSEYRKKTGRKTPSNKQPKGPKIDRSGWQWTSMWDLDENARRAAVQKRAAAGARKTLQAAGL